MKNQTKPAIKTSAKTAQQTRAEKTKIAALPQSTESNLVRVHDLKGYGVIALPDELRRILNQEELDRCFAGIEALEVTLIVRETHDVVYVRIPLMVIEPGEKMSRIPAKTTVAKKPSGRKPKATPKAKPKTSTRTGTPRQERGHD